VAPHAKQVYVNLQGAVSQQAQQLDFCVHRGGHKVDDPHLEGAYILVLRPVFGYDKYIFLSQGIVRGKGFGNFNRHKNLFYRKGEEKTMACFDLIFV
jgi:hypothetical protein